MEGLLGAVVAIIIGQFSVIWWRLGRIEGKLKQLNNNLHKKEEEK